MTINLSSSLAGLYMLTGENVLTAYGSGAAFETRAVREAKKAFTAPVTTPPWKEAATSSPASVQVSAIKRMATIIDKGSSSLSTLPDIQSAFVTYKALDRLRLLAESAAKSTTSSLERTSLEKAFANGLGDLQSFLGQAPSDKVELNFGLPTRRAQSIGVAPAVQTSLLGAGVAEKRDAPLAGVTGNEVLTIKLSKYNVNDTVTVDLSQSTQPPTLDSVSAAINAAIQAIPLRNADGTVQTDANGNVMPRWLTKVTPDKSTGSWGLAINAPGVEKIAIDQVGGKDALMVASGMTALDAPTNATIYRFDDAAGTNVRKTLGTLEAKDAYATAQQATLPAKTDSKGKEIPRTPVLASMNVRAMTTDAQGFTYVVGTTAGDLGNNVSDGADDLFLTKLDSEGQVVWNRTLGAAGSAQGAAVSVGANGDIVVAGTVGSEFNGSPNGDTDMLVMKFDAAGDEKFATSIRALGNDVADAVTVGADGSIFIGGKTATGAGDAFIARIDTSGRLTERRVIDSGGSDSVKALAMSQDGELLALTQEGGTARLRKMDGGALATDLGSLAIGSADARAITVAADGSIAVAGATSAALSGSQVNALSGARDGFVARIDGAMTSSSVTYLGSGADDQVDSVAFMGNDLFVGGRTTGALDGARRGAVDGFVGRLDAASGNIESISQFGQAALRTEPVRVAAATGGTNILGALGLSRGTQNPDASGKVTTETALRAGDEFGIRVNDGTVKKVVIAASDTLTTLADKIRRITGTKATVTTPKVGEFNTLRIDAKQGEGIELIAGAEGKDALEKLGIEPARLYAAPTPGKKDPVVRPGGIYGLDLTDGLSLSSKELAAAALSRIKDALSTTQTAYRSLYWDESKANRVNGSSGASGGGSAYQQAQLAQYQAALDRLSSAPSATIGF